MRSRFAALAVVLLASTIPARSQTPDDQERCAAQARKAFQEWENQLKKVPLIKTLSSDYESHYNTKIRKCLIVISGMSTLASGKGSVTTSVTLMDAYERDVFANYIGISSPTKKEVPPMDCELIPTFQVKKFCANRDEFDAFVAGYMEK
jgi:hypothetical protein